MSRSSTATRVIQGAAGVAVGAAAGIVIADPASDFAVARLEPELLPVPPS